MIYGDSIPEFSVTSYGLVGTETLSEALTSSIKYNCSYSVGSGIGTYEISIEHNLNSLNYNIIYSKGPYDGTVCLGEVAVCAYTGKAVMNLKRKGVPTAMTLHSFLYDRRTTEDAVTKERRTVYTPKAPWLFRTVKLLVVDEASMVSREMFDLISSLPFRTVYIGDHFQLPPVKDSFNIMLNPDLKMERIHRQSEDDPIVMLADLARNGKPIPLGVFGSSKHTRTLNPAELSDYDEVITWTNATKDAVNAIVRKQRGFMPDAPMVDDKMIVRVNNRTFNVYNGQIVYLVSTPVPMKQNAWKVEFVDELAYNDPFIMAQTDAATQAVASVHLPKDILDEIRGCPVTSRKEHRQWKKEHPYDIHLDWGYAITCHAAQGTSWGRVAVLLDDRMKHVIGREEYNRWVYTALTRAEDSVTIYSGGFGGLEA